MKVDGRAVTLKMSSPLAAMQQNENVDNLFVYLNALQSLPQEVAILGASLESVPFHSPRKNRNCVDDPGSAIV